MIGILRVTDYDIERALAEVEERCGVDTANLLRAELARLRQCVELDSDDDVLDSSPMSAEHCLTTFAIRAPWHYLATPAIRLPDEMTLMKGNE